MKSRNVNPNLWAVMLSALILGGAAVALRMVQVPKPSGKPPGCVLKMHNGDMFICGAHA